MHSCTADGGKQRAFWRWRPDLNRRIAVLQTAPLGHLGTPPGRDAPRKGAPASGSLKSRPWTIKSFAPPGSLGAFSWVFRPRPYGEAPRRPNPAKRAASAVLTLEAARRKDEEGFRKIHGPSGCRASLPAGEVFKTLEEAQGGDCDLGTAAQCKAIRRPENRERPTLTLRAGGLKTARAGGGIS